jgi:predicted small metal-binding protein
MSERKVMDETIIHMFEYHAIDPKEMTSEMKSKIKQSIRASRVTVRVQHTLPKLF